MRRLYIALGAATVYLASVILANWLTTHYGFVPVGFGKVATAGTFAAGGALVVRDVLQDAIGRIGVLLLIVTAAALSWIVAAPQIALASGCAFLLAETFDMLVYTPMRRRTRFGDPGWTAAVWCAGVVGAIADTIVFLRIAFGWPAVWSGLPGQLLGKCEMLAALIAIGVMSRALLRQSLDARSA